LNWIQEKTSVYLRQNSQKAMETIYWKRAMVTADYCLDRKRGFLDH
jgi:hypothetical protein